MTIEEKEALVIKARNHVTIEVLDDCVRCQRTHENLNFERIEPPIEVGGYFFTHWALCPNNQTPILLKVDTLSA